MFYPLILINYIKWLLYLILYHIKYTVKYLYTYEILFYYYAEWIFINTKNNKSNCSAVAQLIKREREDKNFKEWKDKTL